MYLRSMEDIRPTAKWANRMLRPLASIYHRLEKHHEIISSISIPRLKETSDDKHSVEDTRVPSSRRGAISTEGCSYPEDEEPNDPAWVPGKTVKRRLRHSYSSRGKQNGTRKRSRLSILSPETQKTLPGAIEIATPLITGKARSNANIMPQSALSFRTQLFQNMVPSVDKPGKSDQRRQTRTNNSSFPAYQGSWKEVLDKSGDPSFVDIALLLDRVFLNFLKSTRVNRSPPNPLQRDNNQGARSLLSMATRRLPDFIAEEQDIQDELEEGRDVDMCDAYFTELEASYAPTGNGWLPLREAARAQGIYMVSEMAQRGWITNLAACRLVEECLFQEEFDAFESLLSSHLARVETYRYPTAFDPPRPSNHCDDPVHILGVYYSRSCGRNSYIFQEITKLLLRRVLPPEWMVTTLWKRCVDGAIQSLSGSDSHSASARKLIEAVILSSANVYSSPLTTKAQINGIIQPLHASGTRNIRALKCHTSDLSKDQSLCPIPIQDALTNLTSSLITALCGMCVARLRAAGMEERLAGARLREMISYLSFTIQRAIGFDMQPLRFDGQKYYPLRRGYVLLAEYVLLCGETTRATNIHDCESVSQRAIASFFGILASRQDIIKDLAGLAVQVFHYSSRAHSSSSLVRTPQEIRTKVSHLARLSSSAGISSVLTRIAAEAAMVLAEKSLDPDDHAWAIEIQRKAVSCQTDQPPKLSPSASGGRLNDNTGLYRWEDSIGEWVASTPVSRPKALHLNIAARQNTVRPARPRFTTYSTSSSSPNSSDSEKTISSVTSSAPSDSRKRADSCGHYSCPQPCKKLFRARSRASSVEKARGSSILSGQHPSRSSFESVSAPVAARTRTAIRSLLQANDMTGHRNTSLTNPTGSASKIEVVIINKKDLPVSASSQNSYLEPVSSRTRRSSLPSKMDNKLYRKPPSIPFATRVERRRTVIPCSQDEDSDDELSFF